MSHPVNVLPHDEHDQVLVSNSHPVDWENPEPASRYNLVVIGAGTAGLVAAAGAAGLGAKVALVEKNLMGGDCLNRGCVPSKALIRASRAFADVRDAGDYGVIVPPGVKVDFSRVMERMRRLRARISRNDSVRRFAKLGVDVFLGEGKFVKPDIVEVDNSPPTLNLSGSGSPSPKAEGRKLCFSKAVIATGARAAVPPIAGLPEAGYLTNETVFSLSRLPKRLAVIGAGPIGCELAQAFARFGSEVTLLEVAPRILIREDHGAAECVEKALLRDGIKLVTGCKIARVDKQGDEKIISLECADKKNKVTVDEILVGVGRAPNVEGMNLERIGVEYDKFLGIKVNDYLETTRTGIYAAGDVCFPYKFTHVADALARIVIRNALFLGHARASTLTIPWCTYTDPEIAHVGMSEKEARDKGIPVQTFVQELKDVDRAILDGEDEGFVKVHVKEGTDKIIGATLVARRAGDMLSEITLAITAGAGLKSISNTIHPYPTQAECIKRLGDAYNRTRLTPLVKGIMTKWLAFKRA